jgi:hypothetical protein
MLVSAPARSALFESEGFMPRIALSLVMAAGLAGLAVPVDAREPAFPRSAASEAVYAAGACWRGCQSYCIWALPDCLTHAPQGVCLKLNDRCDRTCQINCRFGGGPFVSIE